MHEVNTINTVRLSALSPTAFLPRKYKLDRKLVLQVESWLDCCKFSTQRVNVQLLSGIKKSALGIAAGSDTLWSLQQQPY